MKYAIIKKDSWHPFVFDTIQEAIEFAKCYKLEEGWRIEEFLCGDVEDLI